MVGHGLASIALRYSALKSNDLMRGVRVELGCEFGQIRKQCHPASIELMVNNQYGALEAFNGHLRYWQAFGVHQDGRCQHHAAKALCALKFDSY